MPDESPLNENAPFTFPPSRSARLTFGIGVGILCAVYVFVFAQFNPQQTSDFDQVWAAARALVHHQNPYDVIGYNKPFYWWWPFYYPLPAAVLVLPLGALPVVLARCVFTGLSVFAFAYAITRDGWEKWPAFLSIAFVTSVELSQWSPLLTAALLIPWLGWVGVAKPNWGVAIAAHTSSYRQWIPLVTGSAVLLAVSFWLQPGWVGAWVARVRSATHFQSPVMLPFGFLMLLAAAKWRRPEARLLLAIALMPQTPGFYDALMLFVIPRTVRQSLALTVLTFVVFFFMVHYQGWPTYAAWNHDISRFTLWFLYLPSLALVLARPNESSPALVHGGSPMRLEAVGA